MNPKKYPFVNHVTVSDIHRTPVGTVDPLKTNPKFYNFVRL
jgi:hypothetical protein